MIISDKKSNELQEKLKARTAAADIRRYAPAQMAFWPEERRAIANELARSAIFHCGNNRKPRAMYDNAALFMLGSGAMTYTGEELRGKDEDLFMTLAHCARELPSGDLVVKVTSSQICKLNKWQQDQRYYDEIFRSIQRMKGGVITVFSKRLTKAIKCQKALEKGAPPEELARLYDELAEFERREALDLGLADDDDDITGMMISLISGNPVFTGAKDVKDGIPKGNLTWEIPMDKNMVALFAKPYLTHVDFEDRLSLSATGKRLQAYFLSHKNPHPVKLSSLAKMLNLNYADPAALKYNLNTEFENLKKLRLIDFSYEKTADNKEWKVLVTRKSKNPIEPAPTQ
ncbi:hypothetical protein RCH14_004721 [Massilia sp. MP_M2]|uniref:plasmid replication initiator TrfA n=1 Tax=Massilia sp. MP_M2 TaxID=3071713 RepID=UPI00319E819E